ncbi:hypothetical protein CHS0354_027400 [Potamilus streckersoni]|uniref:Ammonium transporter AmtB-like domain-containing protein n=1 Tax=Potamilus streckersoni TaxID=2493646 RepID=A0AAE0W0T3_9BIVA|nr:hypothetical protein CHS0354_027400 [Potamilus streckersoni]
MIKRKKTSLLGLISGVIGGLVTVTPGAGFVGVPGAIIMGLIGGVACWWGVTYLKRMIRLDDSLDVFGIHGVGGIVGALLTGVFTDPALGGSGIYDYVTNSVAADYSIITQVWVQLKAVLVTIVWSGAASAVIFKLVDITIGLRVSEDDEREIYEKSGSDYQTVRLEAVKDALQKENITGMTVSEVRGFGRQKGQRSYTEVRSTGWIIFPKLKLKWWSTITKLI